MPVPHPAVSHNTECVAAAAQNCPSIPAELDNVLAVGATGNTSAKAYYSNYGALYTDVRLYSLHSSSLFQFIAPRLRLSCVSLAVALG